MASKRAGQRLMVGLAAVAVLGVGIDIASGQDAAPAPIGAATSYPWTSYPAPSGPAPAATAPLPAVAPVVAAPAVTGEGRTVSRVIDGDTFEVEGGDRVRVLGIDSCEMSTDAGPEAKSQAESLLVGDVVLLREPGVDRDRYGRLLRYVEAGGLDFGESMVGYSHTGVYEGRNDASGERVTDLRGADYDGRTCDEPEPYVAPAPVYVEDDDDSSSSYSSSDDSSGGSSSSSSGGDSTSARTGNSGHPCLPGERDGDGDGYCGEG